MSYEADPLQLMSVESLRAMQETADAEAIRLELHALDCVDRRVQAAIARRQRGEIEDDTRTDTGVAPLQHLIEDEPQSAWGEAFRFRTLSAQISREIERRSKPASRGMK